VRGQALKALPWRFWSHFEGFLQAAVDRFAWFAGDATFPEIVPRGTIVAIDTGVCGICEEYRVFVCAYFGSGLAVPTLQAAIWTDATSEFVQHSLPKMGHSKPPVTQPSHSQQCQEQPMRQRPSQQRVSSNAHVA
jgi:hypothetical protein